MIARSEAETEKIAADLAATLKGHELIFLRGDLGAGKTVFARALIRALCNMPDLEVISPTFTLVQNYGPIAHYDLYRIEDAEEIFELGWEDSMAEGITIVEWPERLGDYASAPAIDITMKTIDNHAREITIERP